MEKTVKDFDQDPRDRKESEERWATVRRRQRFLAAGWVLLVFAFIGGTWYAYPALVRHDAVIAQFAGVHKTVDAMGDQLKQINAKLENWGTDRQSLRDQVTKLGQNMQAKVEAVAKQAQGLSTAVYLSVQAQIEERLRGVQTRLAHLESASDTAQIQVAELRRELTRTQNELSKQAGQIAAVHNQMDSSGAAHEREFARLREGEESNHRDVGAIEHQLAVHRVNFEVAKNRSAELAEGISLGITSTDVAHRYVSGWMWVMPDRRTIWLKSQNAGQPVIFYGYTDGKKRELVITNVTRGSATGYLLLPGESGESKQMSAVENRGE